MALNNFLLRAAVTGGLGGLLFGFDTAVIAGATDALTQRFSLTPFELGFTVSIALWGTVVGAVFSGPLGQSAGARAVLKALAVFYVLSALGCACAWSWPVFLAARFVGGVAIGGSSVLGPVYIAEIAPPTHRGRLVGLFQINIVVGILAAYCSNLVLATQHLGSREWRWDFGVASVPAMLFLAMLFSIPQSPRWLVMKSRVAEALDTLKQIGAPDPEAELRQMLDAIHVDTFAQKEPLFQRRYLTPILLAVLIAVFNQCSGINAVLYYLNDIFVSGGFSRLSGSLQAVAVGGVNLIFTLVAMALIDRLGRKTLLLFGCAGMTVTLSAIAYVLHTGHARHALLAFVAVYIAFFAISSGAVVWVYISEIFPTRVRMKGQALGSTALWIANGIISQLFPSMANVSTSLPFVFFAGAMATQCLLTLWLFPETKGLSLEELQTSLGIN
jgi:sugar porter (SP) family MFS transporter